MDPNQTPPESQATPDSAAGAPATPAAGTGVSGSTPPAVPPDEKAQKKMLMDRARIMGIKFSPNISIDKLKEKINVVLDAEHKAAEAASADVEDDAEEAEETPSAGSDEEPALIPAPTPKAAAPAAPPKPKVTSGSHRTAAIKDAMRLVRIRVACLNPAKKELHGELFTVGNAIIGTVTKFVPFGDQTNDGYHVPYVIYEHLKERTFLNIQTRNKPGPGDQVQVTTGYIKEFAIEVLPPLSPKEVKKLAMQQSMAAGDTNTVTEGVM